MYLRSTPRRNRDGSEVRYLQLAHNVWDPQLRRSKVQVVYNFGREDAANRDALQRLVSSTSSEKLRKVRIKTMMASIATLVRVG